MNELQNACKILTNKSSDDLKLCKLNLQKKLKNINNINREMLKKAAHALGLEPGKEIKAVIAQQILNMLNSHTLEPGEEKKIFEESMNENIIKKTVDTTINYYHSGSDKIRTMTIIKIPPSPSNIILTTLTVGKTPHWIPGGTYSNYNTCTSIGFYLSSGSSNAINYKGVWFPFSRIREISTNTPSESSDHKGYIKKFWGLNANAILIQRLKELLGLHLSEFITRALFEKFSHWWQVQISAALGTDPDSLWNVHKELIAIKSICFMYVYDMYDGFISLEKLSSNKKYKNIKYKIITEYIIPNNPPITLKDPIEINKWLVNNNALCESYE
jgi:hypothetical protein